jgi:hypothetical protein
MKRVRQSRKAIDPIKKIIGRPAVFTWAGNKAFNKTKGKKFDRLAAILDDRKFQAFCSAIGFIEVNWAFAEQQLDHWAQLCFVTLGGSNDEGEMPRSFSRKIKFLRKSFKNIPALAPYKERALEILGRADKLSETRHDATHAVITSMDDVDGVYEMVNKKLNIDGSHWIKEVRFDVRDFPALSLKLVLLGKDAVHLSNELADEFLRHE